MKFDLMPRRRGPTTPLVIVASPATRWSPAVMSGAAVGVALLLIGITVVVAKRKKAR